MGLTLGTIMFIGGIAGTTAGVILLLVLMKVFANQRKAMKKKLNE